MNYEGLPESVLADIDRRRSAAAQAFLRQDWEGAAQSLKGTYEYLLQVQRDNERRIHKGWELHNWGVALLNVARVDEAQGRILLAYTEDVLSAATGDEAAADGMPAARVLRGLALPTRVLERIKSRAREQKEAGKVPADPDSFLKSMPELSALGLDAVAHPGTPPKRKIEEIASQFERRCFIGGNYFAGGPNLEEIRKAVKDQGYDPLVAFDFEIRRDTTHHRSLLLLHLCPKAIFEVSNPAGQLMELERCRDYDITPLLLRQTLPNADPGVSEMIASMAGVRVDTYSTIADLGALVVTYLTHG